MDFMDYIDKSLSPNVKRRQDLERRITDEIVKALFQQGFVVRIHDGECFCSKRTTDPVAVQKAVQSTDEDCIYVYPANEVDPVAVIQLIYGNDGHDVVSDWSNIRLLDPIIKPIIEKYN